MSTPQEGERTRKPLVRGALAVGTPLAVLLLLEGGARLYLGEDLLNGLPSGHSFEACAVHDPEIGWVNKPGVRTRIEGPKLSYRVEINAQGLRDREHPYAKPEGVLRVVLLGDSLAWGWGVDNGRAFADLVEEDLGPGVEVVNLGVPGYSNDQELWMFEREGRRYEPDLVLLCFVLNDVVGNAGVEHSKLTKPRYARAPDAGEWILENSPAPLPEKRRASLQQRLWVRSGFLQLLNPADSEQQLASSARAVLERRATTSREARILESEKAQLDALADEISDPDSLTFMLLSRLRAACAALDVPLVAFSIAHHHDRYLYSPVAPLPPEFVRPSPDGTAQPEAAPPSEFRTRLAERLTEAGERIGFQTFLVDQAMLEQTEAGVDLSCGDGHLNERGNEVIARRIVLELQPILAGLRAGSSEPGSR